MAVSQSYGEGSYILPDNTQAMMHLNDQFMQIDQQRQAAKAAAAKAEAERMTKLDSRISKDLYNPNNLTGGVSDQIITNRAKGHADKAREIMLSDGIRAADEYINNAAMDIGGLSQRIKLTNERIAKSISERMKVDPYLDYGSLSTLAATEAFYEQDEKGNLVVKNDIGNINPDVNYVEDAYNKNRSLLYTEQSQNKAFADMISKEGLTEVNEPSEYSPKGDRTKVGYKGKLPLSLVEWERNDDGKAVIKVRSENYKIPETGQVYLDPNTGKPIEVLSEPVFEKYYNGAIAAGIDKEVERITNGNPNSAFGDMLKRRLLYEKLQQTAGQQYSLNAYADESEKRKKDYRAEQRAEANLRMAEGREKRAIEKHNVLRSRGFRNDNPGIDTDAIDFVSILDNDYGVTVPAQGGGTMRILTDLDPEDEALMVGNETSKNGLSTVPKIKPGKWTDGNGVTWEGYKYDEESGFIYGADDKRVNTNRVNFDAEQKAKKDTTPRQPKPKKERVSFGAKLKNLLNKGMSAQKEEKGLQKGTLNKN